MLVQVIITMDFSNLSIFGGSGRLTGGRRAKAKYRIATKNIVLDISYIFLDCTIDFRVNYQTYNLLLCS